MAGRLIKYVLVGVVAFPNWALAQMLNPSQAPDVSGASEFYVGKQLGRPLVAVHVVSGVQKPGVYHVPMGTDLAQLIAYAGGASEKADLSDISLRKQGKDGASVVMVNMERILASKSKIPTLDHEDVVHIPLRVSMERSMTWINLISGVASIVLSVAIINDLRDR